MRTSQWRAAFQEEKHVQEWLQAKRTSQWSNNLCSIPLIHWSKPAHLSTRQLLISYYLTGSQSIRTSKESLCFLSLIWSVIPSQRRDEGSGNASLRILLAFALLRSHHVLGAGSVCSLGFWFPSWILWIIWLFSVTRYSKYGICCISWYYTAVALTVLLPPHLLGLCNVEFKIAPVRQ